MRTNPAKKLQHKPQGLFLKYPGPTLAAVMLITVIFSVGAAWSAANARINNLEETTKGLASKEELRTIREIIKAVDQKIDILINRR